MTASIIIVTRNRVADLRQTLEAMKVVRVPDGLEIELLVVDNGSSDETAEVVRSTHLDKIRVRYVHEEIRGLSRGRNRALAETTGEVVVFTDDDVRFPETWLSAMTGPISSGYAKVVCGGVMIAPHLLRPWMTPISRSWLASTELLHPREPENLVGANMAFSREVLRKVPGFDIELGAGALGCGEETLFSLQLRLAGYHIFNRLDTHVEHHFQPVRLERDSWLDAAEKQGASLAYRWHHWEHWECRFGWVRMLRAASSLSKWRSLNRSAIQGEGCSERELLLTVQESLVRHHYEMRRAPRKYEKHGLQRTS